jgi:hypothetical protein
MKIRQCFVANSSSSSFVCEICGRTETGYDASPGDYGYVECVNEHLICDEHRLNEEETENSEGSCGWGITEIPECGCPICSFQEYSQPELVFYLKKKYDVPWGEVFEGIKQFNKRRKKLYNHEYIAEVLKRNNISDDSVLEVLKEQFTSYSEFTKFIGEKY